MIQLLLPERELHSQPVRLRTIFVYRLALTGLLTVLTQAQTKSRAKRLGGTGVDEGGSIAVDMADKVDIRGLITIFLFLVSTLTYAQQSNFTVVYQPVSSLIRPDRTELMMSSIAQSTEYTPLNNLPFFPGGQQALQTYLDDPRRYPHQARICQREGTVQVQFRVMPDGGLAEIRVVRSSEPLLDQAALQAVSEMPRWYPAHRAGIAVSSLYILPVTFRLD